MYLHEQVDIVCNETIFYAESGGQISDKGIILSKDCSAKILNSKKITIGNGKIIFVSTIEIVSGKIKVGDNIKQKVDLNFRKQICSHHSATHLLHEALRQKLGLHVAQKGSLVTNEKLRFDFSHQKPISSELIKEIEDEVNYRIFCNDKVTTKVMSR